MSDVTEDRVVFNIDVGNIPPDQAVEYIKKVKSDLSKKQAKEESGGGAPASKSILLQESAA